MKKKIITKLKNIKINKKKLILIIIIIALILVLVGISLFGPQNEKEEKKKLSYISDEYVELPGTVTITNDALNSYHCIDFVCVSNVKIYYVDNDGRVEYTITNFSDKVASGYFKLNFGNTYILASYNKLKVNKSVNATTMFISKDLSQATDYSIERLSDEEISKIKKG